MNFKVLFGAVAAALALVLAVPVAQAQGPASGAVERFSINVPLGQGYCALDPADPRDAGLIAQNRSFAGSSDLLYRVAVECARLETWRNEPAKVSNATVHLVIWRSQLEQFPLERREAWPAEECKLAREQSGQTIDETKAAFDTRIAAVLAALEPNKNILIGAVPQTRSGCHLVSVLRIARTTGQPASVILLRSTAVVKGRVVQLWHITAADVGAEVRLLADTVARAVGIVEALPGANP